MGKCIFKKIRNILFLIFGGSILGLVALVAVHYIPMDPMKVHVQQSLPMLERDFLYGDAVEGYPATCIGSFTDCLMLEHAIYSSAEHTQLEQALFMYRGESGSGDGWAPGYSLIDYLSGISQNREEEYSRYWHGYLVVLKPLLFFMSFNSIRLLAMSVQLLLVGFLLMVCFRKKEGIVGLSILASLPFLFFSTLYLSLSLSICYYILMLTLIIQMQWNEKISGLQRYEEFFTIVGMSTAYFDFLTYPLVTLGFPLCIYLYLNASTIKESFRSIIVESMSWSAGYVGMWAMKWIFTDLLAGGNTISDAVRTISARTATADGYSKIKGFESVLLKNFGAYTNWGFFLTGGFLVILAVILLIKNRKRINSANLGCAAGILLVGLYPLGWFFLTQNHSEEHWIFTCKILSICVVAFICAVGKMVKPGEKI